MKSGLLRIDPVEGVEAIVARPVKPCRVEPHDGMAELFPAMLRRELEQLALGIDDDAIALVGQQIRAPAR